VDAAIMPSAFAAEASSTFLSQESTATTSSQQQGGRGRLDTLLEAIDIREKSQTAVVEDDTVDDSNNESNNDEIAAEATATTTSNLIDDSTLTGKDHVSPPSQQYTEQLIKQPLVESKYKATISTLTSAKTSEVKEHHAPFGSQPLSVKRTTSVTAQVQERNPSMTIMANSSNAELPSITSLVANKIADDMDTVSPREDNRIIDMAIECPRRPPIAKPKSTVDASLLWLPIAPAPLPAEACLAVSPSIQPIVTSTRKLRTMPKPVRSKLDAAQITNLFNRFKVHSPSMYKKIQITIVQMISLRSNVKHTTNPPPEVLDMSRSFNKYPPLVELMHEHMDQYYELSFRRNRYKDQITFNRRLVEEFRSVAHAHGWMIAPSVATRTIRDRIRSYYNTLMQKARQRLTTMLDGKSSSSWHISEVWSYYLADPEVRVFLEKECIQY
jgi:hypothetical protein